MSVDWNTRQSDPIKPRTRNISLALVAVMIILVAGIAYAILASISVQNNVTVNGGIALGVSTSTTNPTSCPALGSTSYGTVTPYTNTVPWTISAGGSQTEWFCIENQGSGNDASPSITLTTIPTGIICAAAPCLTLTTNPATIPPLNAQSITLPIAVTITATPSATGTGQVDITVS